MPRLEKDDGYKKNEKDSKISYTLLKTSVFILWFHYF